MQFWYTTNTEIEITIYPQGFYPGPNWWNAGYLARFIVQGCVVNGAITWKCCNHATAGVTPAKYLPTFCQTPCTSC
jgi:hypothetical protein